MSDAALVVETPDAAAVAAATVAAAFAKTVDPPIASADGGGDKGKPPVQTIASGGADDEEPKPSPATWPDDWRIRLAGKNEDDLKALGKLESVEGLWKSNKALRRTLSERAKGPEAPGEGATEDDWKAYRKQVGVPEKPEGYLEGLDLKGKVLGDLDKPVAESFAAALHSANIPAKAFGPAMNWYFDHMEKVVAKTVEDDFAYRGEANDLLRDEWGAHKARNVNHTVTAFVDAPGGTEVDNPESLVHQVFHARMPNGRLLGDNPQFVKWLSQMAFLKSEPETHISGEGKSAQSRLDEISALLKTDPDKYWSKEIQVEEQRLIAIDLKQRQRADKAA